MGILIKPIVTEKMTAQGEKLNRYGFIVDRKANKGKRKQRYTKAGLLKGRTNHFKKAYVTLAGEDKIDFYANI